MIVSTLCGYEKDSRIVDGNQNQARFIAPSAKVFNSETHELLVSDSNDSYYPILRRISIG